MYVVDLHAEYRHAHAFAVGGSLYALGYTLGKQNKSGERVVIELEDVILLRLREFGYDKGVPRLKRVDVKEGVELGMSPLMICVKSVMTSTI